MALYAIGDLHLHYQSVLKAPAQLHDRVWKNHEEKFRKNCGKMITAEDTLVLVGDHSWGRNLPECELDLQYIRELPGRKILTRGNHDMFWDAKKTADLNKRFQPELTFLQDSYETYQDYALENRLSLPGRTAIRSLLCSCIICRPVFWRREADLPICRRSMARSR